MNNGKFRTLLATIFKNLNAYYGDNTGSFGDNKYKVNYQEKNVYDEEGQRTYYIDVDVWSNDSIKKENICDQIEGLLNYQLYESDTNRARFIYENRYNADEENIFRTTMSYEVRTW